MPSPPGGTCQGQGQCSPAKLPPPLGVGTTSLAPPEPRPSTEGNGETSAVKHAKRIIDINGSKLL